MQRNQNEKCETWKGEELNCRKQRDLEQRRVKVSTSIDDSEETSERVVFACLEREKVMSRNWNGNEMEENLGRVYLFEEKWEWNGTEMHAKWSPNEVFVWTGSTGTGWTGRGKGGIEYGLRVREEGLSRLTGEAGLISRL